MDLETMKTIEQLNGVSKNLIDSTNSLLTEFNYLRLAIWDKNQDNILNSTTLMHVKLSTLLINLTVLLKHAKNLMHGSKANNDVCNVWIKQINDSNSVLIKLSNELTNFSYFIKQYKV
jgi:hypothetical protein